MTCGFASLPSAIPCTSLICYSSHHRRCYVFVLKFHWTYTSEPFLNNGVCLTYLLSLQVHVGRLSLNEDQRSSISKLYQDKREVSATFSFDQFGQTNAARFMQEHQLDRAAREALENQWSTQWSTKWSSGAPGDHMRRALLQWYVLHRPWQLCKLTLVLSARRDIIPMLDL